MAATQPEIILVAHGSPDPRHALGIERLAARVRALVPSRPVHVAYLDHHGPTPTDAAGRVGGGAVAVPILVTPAYHARVDVPAAVAAMDAGCPGGCREAAPLGPHPALLHGAEELLGAAGVAADPGTAVVLYAAGSSDRAAVRSVEESLAASPRPGWGPWRVAVLAGGQTVEDVVASLPGEVRRTVAVAYLVADGVLRDRMATSCERVGAVLVPGTLCDADAVARLVLARADSLTA